MNANYWKPIQTGADEDSDSRTVAELAGLGPERIFPEAYRFAPPVSPHLAARWAGTEIDLAKIQLPEAAIGMPLIVEGAGGVMVPVYDRHFMVDVMKQLGLPVILAARSTLGTINHTLLSLAALKKADVEIAGVVIIGEPNVDNRDAIRKYGEVRIVGEIPRLAKLNRKSLIDTFTDLFDHEIFIPKSRVAAE
jgi:dethiobiotin synthetase